MEETLETIRHSASHMMAQAVRDLYPGVKVAIGPSIDTGFYYDFDYEPGFTEEDLVKIEKRMQEIVSIRDANGHRSSFSATAPSDRSAPAPVSGPTMQDVDLDGRVDRVAITWSETLATYVAGNTPWPLADVP